MAHEWGDPPPLAVQARRYRQLDTARTEAHHISTVAYEAQTYQRLSGISLAKRRVDLRLSALFYIALPLRGQLLRRTDRFTDAGFRHEQ